MQDIGATLCDVAPSRSWPLFLQKYHRDRPRLDGGLRRNLVNRSVTVGAADERRTVQRSIHLDELTLWLQTIESTLEIVQYAVLASRRNGENDTAPRASVYAAGTARRSRSVEHVAAAREIFVGM